MTETSFRVSICADCVYLDSNGWDERDTGQPLPDPVPMSLLDGYLIGPDADIDDNDAMDAHSDGHFSWSPCDGCGSKLGGTRWDMVAVPV